MPRILTGNVTSTAPDKTVVISVITSKTHPLYKKKYMRTTKFMAHDEKNECKAGDKVSIIETRPISARKRFKLHEIIEKATLTKEDLKAMEADEPKVEKKTSDKKAEKPAKKESK